MVESRSMASGRFSRGERFARWGRVEAVVTGCALIGREVLVAWGRDATEKHLPRLIEELL